MIVLNNELSYPDLKYESVLGLKIFNSRLNDISLSQKNIINTISPTSYTMALNDPIFFNALKESDILLLDGQYFALAPLLLNGKIVRKQSGTDCFYHVMNAANIHGWKVFFLGSLENTLSKIKQRTNSDYPNIKVEAYSPPFKKEFTNRDNKSMIDKINSFNPDILLVGMTAPKQEKWVFQNKEKINARIICSIGAVFDWYAGNQKQPEKIWVNLGLEWFIRTIRRPEILKRYPAVLKFFWILMLNVMRIRRD
jgi:N-acetylglucosaminyldiphosphoundecaprenol N-acetyl-beta-D-mannosaminyltransferase